MSRNRFGKLNAKGVKMSEVVNVETEHTVCRITETNFVEDPRLMFDADDDNHGLLRTFVQEDLYSCDEIPAIITDNYLKRMCDAWANGEPKPEDKADDCVCIPIYMYDDGNKYSMSTEATNDESVLFGILMYRIDLLEEWASEFEFDELTASGLYGTAKLFANAEIACLESYANCRGFQYYVFDKTWGDGMEDGECDEEACTGTTYIIEDVMFYASFIDDKEHQDELCDALSRTMLFPQK